MKITLRELDALVKNGKTPKIDSPTGLCEITDSYIKNGIGSLIKFSDGSELKAAEYHQVILNDKWTCVKDLLVGDDFGTKKITSIEPVSRQDWYDFSVNADHQSYCHEGIVHHNSGKSAIIYSKIRYHLDNMGQNVLLVVPSTQLVEQMFSDFKDYSSENGWDVEENVQILYAGKDRVFSKKVLISTWQSLAAMAKNDPETLKQIVDKTDVGIFDEAHTLGKGTVVIDTVNRFTKTAWRTGTTGTLDDSKIHQLNLIGLLGDPYQVITTKELMDAGQVTPLKIKILLLKHQEELRKFYKGSNYIDEISYLVGSEQRNRFIANLAKACEGPTLILVNFIERHGQVLTDMIKEIVPADRMVEFVHGGVDVKEREQIRKIVEEVKNPILVANASLFSTGTNIPALENIIFGISSKSSIRVRQSIGRGLRLKSGKKYCTLFDISDDLSWKSYQNTTLKHMRERVAIYDKEQFDYKILNIDLK